MIDGCSHVTNGDIPTGSHNEGQLSLFSAGLLSASVLGDGVAASMLPVGRGHTASAGITGQAALQAQYLLKLDPNWRKQSMENRNKPQDVSGQCARHDGVGQQNRTNVRDERRKQQFDAMTIHLHHTGQQMPGEQTTLRLCKTRKKTSKKLIKKYFSIQKSKCTASKTVSPLFFSSSIDRSSSTTSTLSASVAALPLIEVSARSITNDGNAAANERDRERCRGGSAGSFARASTNELY
jgi:hypothetical protein